MAETEPVEQTYNTYIIPFNPDYRFPQTNRLSIYRWVFDFTWSYNAVSKMPILTIKSTSGQIYSINQIVPYFAYYVQDTVTGEPFMTIIATDVSLEKISASVAMNREWSGAMSNTTPSLN